MDLSSFRFFSSLRSDRSRQSQSFAVIGLGRFGRAVCSALTQQGYDVLAVDSDESKVSQALLDRVVAHAIVVDSTQVAALKEAGILEQETVIVAIGNFIQASIITTLNVKEGGVRNVVAKASSEVHETLLRKVGADHVVFPEHEAGCNLALSLTKPGILDRLDLDANHSIVEIVVPEKFHGKTIAELQLRSRYGLNMLAYSQDGKFNVNPDPNTSLMKGNAIVVIGTNKDIDRLPI